MEDDVSPYKDGRVIKIEDERNNKIIELEQKGVPVIDLHIPAKQADGGSAKGTMAFRSLNHGLIYTPEIIVPLLISEENKIEFIKRNKKEPLFFNGISLTDNSSVERSKIMEILPLFEYVVGDAMTMVDHRGRFTRLWIDEDVKVDISVQDYMDRIVNNIVKMLNEKNIDVYVNATYLPDKLMPYYDELWTDKRIEKVVDALVANHIALEINGKKKIPNLKFLQDAKEHGVKFTLGGQDFDNSLRGLDYALDMVLKLNLEAENMYIPK
ncbi:MAG TPA: hypothetical protein DDY68_01435 [Porphyromonadaceae bacterium]|nr:hypothetical protein [Porphyromonadaceae bacterium]